MKLNRMGRWTVGAVAAGLVIFTAGAFAEEPGPDQVRDQIRKLEQKAQALKMDGKMEDAKAVAGEAAQLRDKIAHMERERHQEAVRGEERRRDAQPERGAAERRLQHIREAVAHLREAGMNDIAERIAQEGERMQQQMRGGGDERRGGAPSGGEIEKMRAELQELRQAVRQLNARLDGANRDRPDSKER